MAVLCKVIARVPSRAEMRVRGVRRVVEVKGWVLSLLKILNFVHRGFFLHFFFFLVLH